MADELVEYQVASQGRIEVHHVISKVSSRSLAEPCSCVADSLGWLQPSPAWPGLSGRITQEMLQAHLFPPADDTVALFCGPPSFSTVRWSIVTRLIDTPAHCQWLADCVLQATKSFLDSLGYAKHMMHRF